MDPRAEDVDICDIAHHLSMQCRYGGAVEHFYSTAQHCCLLAEYAEKHRDASALDCLQVLMHDAAEAYLVDIPRPIKQHMPEYRAWDHAITDTVRTWLDMGETLPPPYLDEIDNRIVGDERAQLKPDTGHYWGDHKPLGIKIKPWVPAWAKKQFLMRYEMYARAVFGSPQYIDETWANGPGGVTTSFVASDTAGIEDVCEVDLRGGVGRVKLRDNVGQLLRDADAEWPRPAWKWVHGKFTLIERKK